MPYNGLPSLTPGAACGKNTPHRRNPCTTTVRRLQAALRPPLTLHRRRALGSPCDGSRVHMAGCEPCRRYIDSLRATREVLHRMGQSEPVPSPRRRRFCAECMKTVRAKFSDEGVAVIPEPPGGADAAAGRRTRPGPGRAWSSWACCAILFTAAAPFSRLLGLPGRFLLLPAVSFMLPASDSGR